ncbi:MAG: YdeI/OmpD-associated family protein [Actinomycetota bacterium]|nr:YdeI/OmpD-associated family protein [Actinomycetota bacterium]
MRFHASLELGGKTATGVEVPPEVVAALGPSKRPAVRATINGYTYRSSVASMGGRFMLGVSADVREKAGVQAGDEVDIDVALDTEPRAVNVPADFTAALEANPAAKTHFDGLSYSNRLRIVLSIEGAKAAETRQRRIDKAVDALAAGRAT